MRFGRAVSTILDHSTKSTNEQARRRRTIYRDTISKDYNPAERRVAERTARILHKSGSAAADPVGRQYCRVLPDPNKGPRKSSAACKVADSAIDLMIRCLCPRLGRSDGITCENTTSWRQVCYPKRRTGQERGHNAVEVGEGGRSRSGESNMRVRQRDQREGHGRTKNPCIYVVHHPRPARRLAYAENVVLDAAPNTKLVHCPKSPSL